MDSGWWWSWIVILNLLLTNLLDNVWPIRFIGSGFTNNAVGQPDAAGRSYASIAPRFPKA